MAAGVLAKVGVNELTAHDLSWKQFPLLEKKKSDVRVNSELFRTFLGCSFPQPVSRFKEFW